MPFDEDGDTEKSESAVYDKSPTFDPYDPPTTPEAVQPTSPSPAPSSDAPDFGGTSGADSEQPSDQSDSAPQEKPEEAAPLPEFDPRYRDAFTGLLYLGRLQQTFNLWGHTFVVRTLTTEQLAEVGLIVKPYLGTEMQNAVYQTAVVAAAVVSVDGQPLPGSIEIDNSTELTTVKYPYVAKNWLPAVREEIYNKCFELEILTREVLEALGKASG